MNGAVVYAVFAKVLSAVAVVATWSRLGDVGANVGLGAALGALGAAIAAAAARLGPYGPPKAAGFTFLDSHGRGSVLARSAPSSDAPVVSEQPDGTRTIYTNLANSGGTTWYYITTPGSTPGWVSGENTNQEFPTHLPSADPVHLTDSQLGVAKSYTSFTSAAKG